MKIIHFFADQIEIRSGMKLKQERVHSIDLDKVPFETNQDAFYLINVHCSIGEGDKAQNQSGVAIYRHLLKRFEGNQDKLRVIFYSPLPRNILVDLKPGNFVLNLLPFIQSKYDGLFSDVLVQIINTSESEWPRFNNASENLLSGWALARQQTTSERDTGKIPLKANLLIADDEFRDWALTYLTIFDNPSAVHFPPYGSQKEFRQAWLERTAVPFISEGAAAANYVLADLYIVENHERTKPFKTREDVEEISGFKLFNALKERFPFLPYMVYSTSNKVWNQEAFREKGVWGRAVKDNSADLSNEDKIAQFEYFRQCLTRITEPEWRHAARIWTDLVQFGTRSDMKRYWWYRALPDCLDILWRCLTIIESVYSRRALFESTRISDFSGRQCAQVVNTIGGMCETLEITEGRFCLLCGQTQTKSVGAYIFMLRSFYSHELFFTAARPLEALFCIDLLLKLLMLSHPEFHDQSTERMVRDPKFVRNSNVNFLLQFEDLIARRPEIRYDPDLLTDLKASYADVTEDIISRRFCRDIENRSRVLELVQDHRSRSDGA